MKNRSVFKSSCHAEMDLLNKLGEKASGSTLYLYRFNNSGHPDARSPKNGKPCLMCQHVLKNAGVAKVMYLDNNGKTCVLKNRDMVSMVGHPHYITSRFLDSYGNKHHGMFLVNKYVA